MRNVVVAVARELSLARVKGFASSDYAVKQLGRDSVQGIMLWAEDAPSLDFIARLRAGSLAWHSDLPLAILAPPSNARRIEQLLAHRPDRLLLTPFRIKDLIMTLEHLVQMAKPVPDTALSV